MPLAILRRSFQLRVVQRSFLAACIVAAFAPVIPPRPAAAQNFSTAERVVEGKVFNAGGSLQSGAVVYLKDLKSLEIKTYISTQDGLYRFGQLGSQDDYQLWAEFGGHKSKVKTISSFDSKKHFEVFLHIEDK